MMGAGAVSVFFSAVDDPRLELAAEGGGDLMRGEEGHCGVVSPDPPPEALCALGSLDTASVTGPVGS